MLRILIRKVNLDVLEPTKAVLKSELYHIPIIYTYENSLQLYRNMVN